VKGAVLTLRHKISPKCLATNPTLNAHVHHFGDSPPSTD
jgi:hypothetical protein